MILSLLTDEQQANFTNLKGLQDIVRQTVEELRISQTEQVGDSEQERKLVTISYIVPEVTGDNVIDWEALDKKVRSLLPAEQRAKLFSKGVRGMEHIVRQAAKELGMPLLEPKAVTEQKTKPATIISEKFDIFKNKLKKTIEEQEYISESQNSEEAEGLEIFEVEE